MIANDQEFAVVSRQLQELKEQRDGLLRGGNGQAFPLHVEVAGIEKMIARLQGEIDAYANPPPGEQAREAQTVAGNGGQREHAEFK